VGPVPGSQICTIAGGGQHKPVGAAWSITSCGLAIIVDQSAESDPDRATSGAIIAVAADVPIRPPRSCGGPGGHDHRLRWCVTNYVTITTYDHGLPWILRDV
jgi:hypothetical protein